MRRSDDRVLVTHTGSLPRPPSVRDLFARQETHGSLYADAIREGVAEVVRRQVAAGVDIVNDGEMGKESYGTYVRDRLTGFGGVAESTLTYADVAEFPEYRARWAERMYGSSAAGAMRSPACDSAIGVKDLQRLRDDIENLRRAMSETAAADVFMSAASPGVVAAFFANHHYANQQDYLKAIADAMKQEYEAIVAAGFVLQLDCPDLAMCRHMHFQSLSLEEFRAEAALHVEVLNEATANIDPDRMRMHLCWGNYEGPHHKDVPLRDIVDIVLGARPNGLVLEAANPRHQHEWQVFESVALPPGKVLVPGVVDSTVNYIEHPDLVAQRIVRYAKLVGRDNMIAGTDCGFSSSFRVSPVDERIMWRKFEALSEGARRATRLLGGRR